MQKQNKKKDMDSTPLTEKTNKKKQTKKMAPKQLPHFSFFFFSS